MFSSSAPEAASGTFAVQIAKAYGARVIGVASSAKSALVRSIGADDVIDYTVEDFTSRPDRYHVVLDIAGNRPLSPLRRALTADGTLVIVGGEGGGRWLGRRRPSASGPPALAAVGHNLRTCFSTERPEDLEELRRLTEHGDVAPVVDRAFPMSAVPDAIRYLRSGHARGKAVVTV